MSNRLVRLARLSCWRRDRRKPTELGGFVAVLLSGVGLAPVLVGGCWEALVGVEISCDGNGGGDLGTWVLGGGWVGLGEAGGGRAVLGAMVGVGYSLVWSSSPIAAVCPCSPVAVEWFLFPRLCLRVRL
jgi:hypothetical protein